MLEELKSQWKYTLKGSENLIILRNTQTGRIRPRLRGFRRQDIDRYIEKLEMLFERNMVPVLKQPLLERL